MRLTRLLLVSLPLVVILLGATFLLNPQKAAFAHTAVQARHARAMAGCSGNGCNNKDPIQTGCTAGAYTVQTGVLARAYIELRYSPTCKTNWARVLRRVNANDAYRLIIQRADGLTYSAGGLVGPVAWSNMVYAPVAKARACVSINGAAPACTIYV